MISHELLFNADLPDNVRIVAVPEINKFGTKGRDNGTAQGRVNGNGVNLNRNFPYFWDDVPTGAGTGDYKGAAAGSEPETQALINFLNSLGKIELAISYHDDVSWVASAKPLTPANLARIYSSKTPDINLRSDENGTVNQRGSLESWYNQKHGTPGLLVELSRNQSQAVILNHVEAVKAVIEGGGI